MEKEHPRHADLVDERLVYWHFMAALIFMGASMLGGLLMALQLLRLNPFAGIELLSPGRWRMIHTNAIAYGFIANAFLGGLQWIVPRLTLRPVYKPKIPVLNIDLSWAIFWAWQLVVGATAVGLLLGQAQALEWGETPVWIDPVAQLGLLLVAINYIPPIAKVEGPAVCHPLVFSRLFRLDFPDLCHGELHAPVLRHGNRRRGSWRAVHSRSGRAFRDPPGLGPHVLLRADLAQEADLEPWTVVGRLLGSRVLLPAPGNSPFPLHADSHVLAVRSGDLDHRPRTGGRDRHLQFSRHPAGIDRRADHEPADPLVL